jgi:hypothetical protein
MELEGRRRQLLEEGGEESYVCASHACSDNSVRCQRHTISNMVAEGGGGGHLLCNVVHRCRI